MKYSYLLFFLSISCFFSCSSYSYLSGTKTVDEIKMTENRLEKVYHMCLGHFTNETQARSASSPIYKAQELISVPMWTKRTGEHWAYVSLMQQGKTEDLLSQEVWEFKRKDPETIEVFIYEVPKKDNYKGDWKKKEPLSNLKPADLIAHGDCNTYITRSKTNVFSIKSGRACKRNFTDIVKYINIDGEITPNTLVLHNEMLDINQKKIFAYEEGIQFVRLPKDDPRY